MKFRAELLISYLEVWFQSSSRWLLHCLTALEDVVKGGFVLDRAGTLKKAIQGNDWPLYAKLGLWKSPVRTSGFSRSKVLWKPVPT